MCFCPFTLRLALVFAGIAVAVPSVVWADAADDQYAVAAAHYSQGRWKLAAEEFGKFLADFPDHAKANRTVFYLAESLVQLRQFEPAAGRFREFIKRAPQDRLAKKALFRAGEASFLASQWEDAERDLTQFLAQAGDESLGAYAYPYLGDLALRKLDFAAAQRLYGEGLAKYPQGPLQDDCRFGLGRAYEQQGQHEEAQKLYLALAGKTASPWADDAQFRIGASQYAAGQHEAALASFDELEAKFPKSPWKESAVLAGGKSLYFLGRLEKSESRFAALVPHAELGREARYWLGMTQKASHRWELAVTTLNAAAEMPGQEPSLAAIRIQVGDALLYAGKPAEAEAQFDRAQADDAAGALAGEILLGKARAALALGQHERVDQLAADFATRLAGSPLVSSLGRVRARSLLTRKDYAQAIAVLEPLAQSASPTAGDAARNLDAATNHYLLALAYQGSQKVGEALAALTAAEKLGVAELQSDILRARATALVALDKFAEAIASLEAYLATSPAPADAAWALGQLAICQARENQSDKARQTLALLSSQYPKDPVLPPTVSVLAEAALQAGDAARSAELFGMLTAEGNPPEFVARGLSGVAWGQFKTGDLESAAATFQQLLDKYPNDALSAEAALTRGQILQQLKQLEPALIAYRLVLERYGQSPQAPQAILAVARLHNQQRQFAEAAEQYARLDREFSDRPDHDSVLYEWSWALRDLGQAAESDALFERVRARTPRSRFWSDSVYRLAESAWQAQDNARASELLAELLGGEPDDKIVPHALYLQGQIAVASEKWDEVSPPLQRLMKDFPESPLRLLGQYWLAESAYRQADYAQAGEQLATLAQQTQGSQEKWLGVIPLRQAQILSHEKKWPEALELAQSIESNYPGFEQQYEVDYLIGRCLASDGSFEQARESFRKVIRSELGAKTETAAMAQWMIGESFFHQKNYETALREYLRLEILYAYPTWQAAALLEAGKCHEKLGEWKQAGELYARLLKAYPETTFTEEASRRLRDVQERAQGGGKP